MDFLFDLPSTLDAVALILVMCLLAVGGLLWFRRHVLTRLRFQGDETSFSVAMVPSIMVFYGLVMALVSVHVWENNQAVQTITSQEATSLAVLYRDASNFPEPTRGRLQELIRTYVEYVIREAWPLQRKGIVPTGGPQMADRFEAVLMSFEPSSEAQKILTEETIRAYNRVIEARRLRLDAVDTRLPAVMWWVILVGAAICFLSSYYFPVSDVRVHAALVSFLAAFVGLLLFLIVALDRPFRGDLGISSRSYELVYDQLMKR